MIVFCNAEFIVALCLDKLLESGRMSASPSYGPPDDQMLFGAGRTRGQAVMRDRPADDGMLCEIGVVAGRASLLILS